MQNGSRKAKVYAAFKQAAIKAAHKKAAALGLSENSAKTWTYAWLKGQNLPADDKRVDRD
jgi:hypothetical protein